MSKISSPVKKIGRKIVSVRDRVRQRGNLVAARKQLANLINGEYFVKPLPTGHIVQWASPNLASDILDHKINATDDPKRRNFGFETKKDYEFWSWRICGLMCVKNVLDTFDLSPTETVATLTRQGVKFGGYDVKNDKGWYYQPLIKLAEKFGLSGQVHGRLAIEEIAAAVLKNEFVIASVHPKVARGDLDKNPHDGAGHLVLIVGFRFKNGKVDGFYINNPSGRTAKTQKKFFASVDLFDEMFAGRGFSLQKAR